MAPFGQGVATPMFSKKLSIKNKKSLKRDKKVVLKKSY